MGNKLDATRIALDKGFTGVSDPTTTLSSITKGMQDVASWKKGIDDAEIKLKTDTAKAYQDAKKLASERMTGNKTVDAAILEALQSTQDRLYDNQKMLQKGMISPTDNLIFRENASKSYEILSSYLKDYDANFQQSLKEMQGYTDEKGNYIKPTGGAFQAAIQKFQTTLGNPNLYKIVSSEDGSLNMSLYKTKINTTTNTRELVLDADGNPIVDPTMSGIGASTLLKGKNQKSPRVYMDDSINKALAEDTALSKAFQVMKTQPGYTGIVVDDARNNLEIKRLIDAATVSGTATVEQRMSILMDNMPPGMEQIPVMPNEVDGLKAQGIDLNKQIEYTYLDPSTGATKPGAYNKYVISTLDPMSNLFMPEETDEAEIAAQRIFKSAVYAGLERKITGRDTKPKPSAPNAAADRGEKLIDDATTIFGAINKTYGGDAQKDVSAAATTLQNSSDYKFQKQEDIMDGDGVKIGLAITVANDDGATRTDNVMFKVKDDNGNYINATADEYGKQLYQLFKTKNHPSYDKVKRNYLKNNKFLEDLNEKASRKYVPKITKSLTTEALAPVTITTSLNKDNESPITIIQKDLDKIGSSSYEIYDSEINDLSKSITESINAGQTKYGEDIDFSVDADTTNETITIGYGDGKSQVINLTLEDGLEGPKLVRDIKNKLDIVFKNLFPAREESTKQVTVQGGETTTTRRTIAQIMTEDKVDMKEATKIFNAQK